LLLSTLEAYFRGKKELFKGLAIEKLETEWTEYPVFHIDLNIGIYNRVETLGCNLRAFLKEQEVVYGYTSSDDEDLAVRFYTLLQTACRQTGKKVVVLIDEYDKPLLDTMHNEPLLTEMRAVLRGFYGVLKSADPYLRFLLLTGVTKFAQVNVFSGLNQLRDISLDREYNGLCGITETELIADFQPELHALAQSEGVSYEQTVAEMQKRYDGYHFARNVEGVYNPFSVLNTFVSKEYRYYWFKTGTPTFLTKLVAKNDLSIPSMENDIYASQTDIEEYRSGEDNMIPFLYQSGYLTIKDYQPQTGTYILGFPNEEVRYGFLNALLVQYVPKAKDSDFNVARFVNELQAGRIDDFMSRCRAFFASVPYGQKEKTENYYQTTLYTLLTLIGQYVEMEKQSARGRADMVVTTRDTVYLFEFKMAGNGSAEDALRQIDEKGYLIPYSAGNRRVVKIGAEFSEEERTLGRWVIL
jgi:hypothetical protein